MAVAAFAALAFSPSALAAGPPELTPVVAPLRPADRDTSPLRILAAARASPAVRAQNARLAERVFTRGEDEWQVNFSDADGDTVVLVIIDDDAKVLEAWSGVQVDWQMARGYPGAFGREATALPIWLGLLVLFLAPFARPPWRLLHLDLLALASLSVSFAFFSEGEIDWSVPLVYPPLLYLLGRLLFLARRPDRPPEPLVLVGVRALGAGIAFLLAFRLGLQLVSSNVIDVGYAGVIGADRITGGEDLYGSFPADNRHGDTYGPLVYLAYVPFELIWPWSGTWDDLPAAHVASAVFDLACVAGLYLVGRRRSQTLGLLLAYLWLACPFTLMVANSGANDALTGALILAAVATSQGARPPGWRSGALGAAAALTKLAPVVLLPLLVRTRGQLLGALVVFAAGFAFVAGDLRDFVDAAVLFQVERDSPFSIWGLYDLPGQLVAVAAVAVLALVVARRGGDRFALAAALLIAVQLTAGHWFYLYLDWLLPVAFVALLAPYAIGRSTGSIETADRGVSAQRMSTALSQGSSVAVP